MDDLVFSGFFQHQEVREYTYLNVRVYVLEQLHIFWDEVVNIPPREIILFHQ